MALLAAASALVPPAAPAQTSPVQTWPVQTSPTQHSLHLSKDPVLVDIPYVEVLVARANMLQRGLPFSKLQLLEVLQREMGTPLPQEVGGAFTVQDREVGDTFQHWTRRFHTRVKRTQLEQPTKKTGHVLQLVPPVEKSSQPKCVGKKNKQWWKGWVAVDKVPEAGRAFWTEVVPS